MLLLLLTGFSLKSFKKLDVTSLEAALDGASCPGMTSVLTVHAIEADGTRHDKVRWKNLDVAAGGVDLVDGRVRIPEDPAATWGATGSIRIQSKHHEGVYADVLVPIDYDCSFTADFSGAHGRAGNDGQMGSGGNSGKDEQSSESYAAPGGHGERGGDGQDGGDGEPGRDAEDLTVQVDLLQTPDGRDVLLAQANGRSWVVDPNGGSLVIRANGGNGGRGGNGGLGGSGGGGGTGAPPGNGGDGGNGGNGGNGADGGDGGAVTLVIDPQAKPHAGAIRIENSGGSGGPAGNLGHGGTGGNTFSGAEAGESGEHGVAGQRDGRPGRDGPEPTVQTKSLSLSL